MNEPLIEPKVYRLGDMVAVPDKVVPRARIAWVGGVEGVGGVGMYFMEPGAQTTVFTLEAEDDRTADEYYGPCHEFYYILVGEFSMCWGKDAVEVRSGRGKKLDLKAGDLGYWSLGWKYSVTNTGKIPGTFFWGLSGPAEGIKRRVVPEVPEWLKKSQANK